MNERLKELRIALGIKQGDFANRVSTTQGHISDIENGRKDLSDRTIKIICLEFNVNEEWLRNGIGDMFNSRSTDEELAYIVGSAIPTASDYVKDTFIALGKLSKEFSREDWEVVKKFIDTLAGK